MFIARSGSPTDWSGSSCVAPTAVTKGQEAGKVGLKTVPLIVVLSMCLGLIPSTSLSY